MLKRLGADQTTLNATGFQGREQRNTIDAGGFHRDRLDTAVDEPVRQRLKISGVGAKSTDDLLVVTVGDAGHDFRRTNIHTSGVGVDRAHTLEGTSFAMGRSGTMASAQLAHGGTPFAERTRRRAMTLDYLRSIACSSGSMPPVSDACVIENHVARRDLWSPVDCRVSTRDRSALLYSMAV